MDILSQESFHWDLVGGYGNVGYDQYRRNYCMRQVCGHVPQGPLKKCYLNMWP